MKYVLIHGDGMADWPCEELGGMTPLAAAHKPNMELMATRGTLGMVATIPKGMPPGSDVGTMTMLGYDPARYHTGRAPIEAASQGIEMGPRDVVFRMNLVSLKPDDGGALIMNDFTSGHISSEEAAQIVTDLRTQLAGGGIEVFQRRQLPASDDVARRNRDDESHAPARHHGQARRSVFAQGRGGGFAPRSDAALSGDFARASGEQGAPRGRQDRGDFGVVLGAGHAARGADAEGTLRRRRLGDIGRRSGQRPGPAGRTEPDQGAGRHRISRHRLRREGALRSGSAQSARLPAVAYRGARRSRSHGPRRSEEGSDRAYRR